jgi:hypothetical protein
LTPTFTSLAERAGKAWESINRKPEDLPDSLTSFLADRELTSDWYIDFASDDAYPDFAKESGFLFAI